MNTQIQPLEIPLKGTATQLFIRTSTEGVYNPIKFDVKIACECHAKLFQLCNQ